MIPVSLVGTVTAGLPIFWATQNIENTVALPADLIGHDYNIFMLHIKGGSMINAGILYGDLIMVREQPTANNGEIVVALIDEEATVKRFYKEADRYPAARK